MAGEEEAKSPWKSGPPITVFVPAVHAPFLNSKRAPNVAERLGLYDTVRRQYDVVGHVKLTMLVGILATGVTGSVSLMALFQLPATSWTTKGYCWFAAF